jgi:hypothetical protein
MFPRCGLCEDDTVAVCGRDVVRVCRGCGGRTNRSAMPKDEGGDFGSVVRRGKLPGDSLPDTVVESPLCWFCCFWFFANVGVNSGPPSNERKRMLKWSESG